MTPMVGRMQLLRCAHRLRSRVGSCAIESKEVDRIVLGNMTRQIARGLDDARTARRTIAAGQCVT